MLALAVRSCARALVPKLRPLRSSPRRRCARRSLLRERFVHVPPRPPLVACRRLRLADRPRTVARRLGLAVREATPAGTRRTLRAVSRPPSRATRPLDAARPLARRLPRLRRAGARGYRRRAQQLPQRTRPGVARVRHHPLHHPQFDDRAPQRAIHRILRETGYEAWHGTPVGLLSAECKVLRVYHTPQMQSVVAEIVDRFVNWRRPRTTDSVCGSSR